MDPARAESLKIRSQDLSIDTIHIGDAASLAKANGRFGTT
jgi:hypothetical protein